MSRAPDEELVRHAFSLRGLARALVGADEADDLVHDAVVEAVGLRDGETPRAWRAWLARVMRNTASSRWLGTQRRRARESSHGELRDEREAPSADVAAAHHETIERLHRALLALPQPYRDALLLRYFEGLAPKQIAARCGVSLSTVTSRLQRGLAQLRGKLAQDGADWRSGLAVAFGLGSGPSGKVAAGAVAIGALLMTWKFVFGAVLAAVVTLAVWFRSAVETEGLPARVGDPSIAHVARAEQQAPGSTASIEPRREAASPDAAGAHVHAEAQGVAFFGRCVDEHGTPLAGVEVALSLCRLDGGAVVERSTLRTQGDGVFELVEATRFGCVLVLSLRREGRATLEGRFDDVEDGQRVDLGNLVLFDPRAVHLHVVDVAGVPQPGVEVSIARVDARETRVKPYRSAVRATTGADGVASLVGERAMAPGEYRVMTRWRRLVDGLHLHVVPSAADQRFEVVVGDAGAVCRGVVVDPSGAPIEGADAFLHDAQTKTDARGTFELRTDPNRPPGEICVRAAGFHEARVAWSGACEPPLRIELEPQPGLLVRAVDRDSRTPIARFAVWLVAELGAWPFAPHVEVGEHEGGVVHVPVADGVWFVCVEVPGQPVRWSALTRVEVGGAKAREVVVRMPEHARREVLVRRLGEPVRGAQVDLVDRGGRPVVAGCRRYPMRAIELSNHDNAHLVARVTTDADGRASLEGMRAPLALLVSGDGFPEHAVQNVDLGVGPALVVDVDPGAELRGRLVPEHVAARLWQLGRARPNRKPAEVGLWLVAENGRRLPPSREPIPFDESGHFVVRAPTGRYWLRLAAGVTCDLDAVELVGSMQRTFDVAPFVPIDVALRVTIDGVPAARVSLSVHGTHAIGARGRPASTQADAMTDEHGVANLTTCIGRLEVLVEDSAAGRGRSLVGTVEARGAGDLDLDLRTGGLDLLLVDGDDAPVRDVELRVGPNPWQLLGRTDDDGRLHVARMVAGRYPLQMASGAGAPTALGDVVVEPAAAPGRMQRVVVPAERGR